MAAIPLCEPIEKPVVRIEHDLLGDFALPADRYYGVQTARALENFRITGIKLSDFPHLVAALAMVKKAAARANRKFGILSDAHEEAISEACDEIIAGSLHDQFVVDMIQGGAGTSTNMNANEVIANRALELLGHGKGEYSALHPNNHVNLSQSTNDVYPTAVRLCILRSYGDLRGRMDELRLAMQAKGEEFQHIVKMGRTQLQDAVPMTLGQEFSSFATTIGEDIARLDEAARLFREVNMGATAIGTGINSPIGYSETVIEVLSELSGEELVPCPDLVEATSDTGAFVSFSSVLKRIAVKLSKICNDLRLLSSGPRTGLGEIRLPAVQPGSSIMPGKVNPVIPEVVNQVAYQVIGHDLTVTFAAEAGQLQLNAFEPVIAFDILQSIRMLTRAIEALTERCVKGITAEEQHCHELVKNSLAIVTALNPRIGYENATRIATLAQRSGRPIADVALAEGLLSAGELGELLDPQSMIGPTRGETLSKA
ncbi:aspartate ammonia-lyase [Rhizobium mongolense]|uniref:aspartate ammonia-lyase n=1 Tax=Rhizobium mongolense TaxID=57676 RepID=UPI00355726EE